MQHPRYRRLLDRSASAELFALLGNPRTNVRRGLVKSILRSVPRRSLSGKNRLYLNIGHTGLDDPGYSAWAGKSGVRPVYLVHDLIPITHPEYCRAGEKARHTKRMQTVLSTGFGVIGNSQATLDELESFRCSQRLPSVPSVAAWLGTPDRQVAAKPLIVPDRPTFVILGTIEARKNHIMLLQIWSRLIDRMGDGAPQLLIVGQRGWECEQVFDLLDRGETLRRAVVELANCDDDAMMSHITTARALLFPSLVEGYGLPLVEALKMGTPVIGSDLPVFREIGQGIPEFLDPLDEPEWEQAILSYAADDSPRRRDQLSRMGGYRPPTWQEHFDKVEAWLSRL